MVMVKGLNGRRREHQDKNGHEDASKHDRAKATPVPLSHPQKA
jgi:hypothetical protein